MITNLTSSVSKINTTLSTKTTSDKVDTLIENNFYKTNLYCPGYYGYIDGVESHAMHGPFAYEGFYMEGSFGMLDSYNPDKPDLENPLFDHNKISFYWSNSESVPDIFKFTDLLGDDFHTWLTGSEDEDCLNINSYKAEEIERYKNICSGKIHFHIVMKDSGTSSASTTSVTNIFGKNWASIDSAWVTSGTGSDTRYTLDVICTFDRCGEYLTYVQTVFNSTTSTQTYRGYVTTTVNTIMSITSGSGSFSQTFVPEESYIKGIIKW